MAQPLFITRTAKTSSPRKRAPVNAATFIQRSRSESSGNKAAWNNETRQFFDLNDADTAALADGLEKLMAQRLGNLGR